MSTKFDSYYCSYFSLFHIRFFVVTESGIFLLRFSDSQPGQIAISYTDYEISSTRETKLIVGHCLVDQDVNGLTLTLAKNIRKYDSLKNLLIDCKKLKYFYPDILKTDAFEFIDRLPYQFDSNTI